MPASPPAHEVGLRQLSRGPAVPIVSASYRGYGINRLSHPVDRKESGVGGDLCREAAWVKPGSPSIQILDGRRSDQSRNRFAAETIRNDGGGRSGDPTAAFALFAALAMVALGADRGCDAGDFVEELRGINAPAHGVKGERPALGD
jgi:hypothetical protein